MVAVIDMKITETTGADLNHLVRKILKTDFISAYTITDVPACRAPVSRSNAGKFQSTSTLRAVDLYVADFIKLCGELILK